MMLFRVINTKTGGGYSRTQARWLIMRGAAPVAKTLGHIFSQPYAAVILWLDIYPSIKENLAIQVISEAGYRTVDCTPLYEKLEGIPRALRKEVPAGDRFFVRYVTNQEFRETIRNFIKENFT